MVDFAFLTREEMMEDPYNMSEILICTSSTLLAEVVVARVAQLAS